MSRLGWWAASAAIMGICLIGCGGSSSSSSKVTSVVKTYLSALAKGQATRACDQITASEVQVLEQAAQSVNASTCVQAMNFVSQSLGGDNKQALLNAKVVDVQVSGDSATARLQGGTSTIRLIKTGDHWFISGGFGTSSGAPRGSSTGPATTTTSGQTSATASSTTTSTSAAASLAVAEAGAARARMKLEGYSTTPVRKTAGSGLTASAGGPAEGFQATKDGVTVYVVAYSDPSSADASAASLKKGAAAGRGAVTQSGSLVFFALGASSSLQSVVDQAAKAAGGS